ncbi:hypothetical protein SAMN05444003_0938 [Cognatiyoonia sediminum]|uniref:DUF1223 domain-containing protein n=1 Tax=Cognatiyoonia sediminum TaxID=1508389 RepID=A0A1M5MPH7_9RHOB|nr:DUF1223 domain-containing protein [Cognatiyoonia sediminum]SHG79146.1 hypothetical protein SAMN05444003_0938 [Cognatiyoonia sediminum]
MRALLSAFTIASTVFGSAVVAENATVVELYTSQGCSSCPPADEILAELSDRDDVIALALHVDYWDYLGWVDDLANPAHTERQRAFARAKGARTIYTPQMVFGGVDHVIGSRPMEVMEQIEKHGAEADAVEVSLNRNGDTLRIDATQVGTFSGDAVVQIVRFMPAVTRDIRRGENAGRSLTYHNVVSSWQNAMTWDTGEPLAIEATVSGSDAVAVIIQDGTDGPVLGAAQLR